MDWEENWCKFNHENYAKSYNMPMGPKQTSIPHFVRSKSQRKKLSYKRASGKRWRRLTRGEGGSAKRWPLLTEGGGGVYELLFLADVICEQPLKRARVPQGTFLWIRVPFFVKSPPILFFVKRTQNKAACFVEHNLSKLKASHLVVFDGQTLCLKFALIPFLDNFYM